MAFSLKPHQFPRLYSASRKFQRFSSRSSSARKGLILGAYSRKGEDKVHLTAAAENFNEKSKGKLVDQIKLATDKVKPGQTFIFWGLDKEFHSVAVVGVESSCDQQDECELMRTDKESVRVAVAAGCKALDSVGVKDITVENFSDAESAAEGGVLATWKFQEYKSKKEELPTVQLYAPTTKDCIDWQKGAVKAQSQNLARGLADTPSNLLTPTIFAAHVQETLSHLGVEVKVYDECWAQKQKMGAFLSVAKGSCEPPKFVELTYKKNDSAPYALVGKGVTFDSGGISIKPSANMDAMRADMGGAAAIVGALFGIATLKLETHIKAFIPMVENMPSGTAVKPGDVIRARNGKSICVDNTDAEGRLILADALCYSADFNPTWTLDIATLTGAMRVALGDGATGVFTNSNDLYQLLEASGAETGDRVWRMPLWKHYTKQIAKNAAYDLNNIGKGGKGGGSCTAAAFLREFLPKNSKWMHLDIAGVMGPDDTAVYLGKGMTGRPTRTLIEFIAKHCEDNNS